MGRSTEMCPFCGGVGVLHWHKESVLRCDNCELLFKLNPPAAGDLARQYSNSWSDPETNKDNTGGTDGALARLYVRRLCRELGVPDLRGLRILDFGAGRGAFVDALAQAGADAFGLEPFGYDYLRLRGVRVFKSLDSIPTDLKFHAITSLDVIEHLREPWISLAQMLSILESGGWVLLSTVNASGANARVRRSRWREVRKAAHLVFFTPTSLEGMIRSCGYVKCRRLRWFVPYHTNPARQYLDYALQGLGMDGALRYLAWKAT